MIMMMMILMMYRLILDVQVAGSNSHTQLLRKVYSHCSILYVAVLILIFSVCFRCLQVYSKFSLTLTILVLIVCLVFTDHGTVYC